MKITSISNDRLLLKSGVTESNFGRMNYSELITENGLIAVSDNSEKGDYTFAFDKWSFDDVISVDSESGGERIVHYAGSVPLENASVTDLTDFSSPDTFDNVTAVISAITQGMNIGEKVPENGAGGILIFKNTQKTLILFLPEKLFSYSVQSLSLEDQGEQQTLWKNEGLHDTASLNFIRSVMVYKLFTGIFPYSEVRSIERNADIIDKKFIPMEMLVPSVNRTITEICNNSLVLTPAILTKISEKKKNFMYLAPKTDFPVSDLRALKKDLSTIKEEADKNRTDEQVQGFLKKQANSVNTKRKFRKNQSFIVAGLIIFTAVGLLITDSIKSRGTNYTSIGLTSDETLEAYYTGFGRVDTNIIDMLSMGEGTKEYTNLISQVFVISKQREQYNKDMGLMTPASYLLYATDMEKAKYAGLFGITSLKIDGKLQDMIVNVPKKNDHPVPLTTEKNVTLEDGMTSVHKVNFYRFHTEGDNNDIYIEYHTDTVTLTFVKNRWMLTNIDVKADDIFINTDDFLKEYWDSLKKHNNNVKEALVSLRPKYPWLPTANDIEMEEKLKAQQLQQLMESFGQSNYGY